MNSVYSEAKRKFEALRKRLHSLTPDHLPNEAVHLEAIKNAVREQFPLDKEQLRKQQEEMPKKIATEDEIEESAKRRAVIVAMARVMQKKRRNKAKHGATERSAMTRGGVKSTEETKPIHPSVHRRNANRKRPTKPQKAP
jgi:hypothetical protein